MLTGESKKFRYRYKWVAYLMILPALAMLAIFVFTPLVMSIIRSFLDSTTGEFRGFFNFHYILSDSVFLKSLLNVFVMSTITTVLIVVTGFLFANVLVELNKMVSGVVKVFIFLPYLLSGIVTSIIFLLMLNYGGGLFTSILYSLGKPAISFATEGLWPYVWIIIPSWWMGFGYNTLVLYAGLLNVPRSYYEAAELDGANTFMRMLFITIPNMKNYFVLLLINLTAGGLQMFEVPLMITQGGPTNKTTTPVLFLVNNFKGDKPQNAILAGALMMMVVIALVNFFVFKIVRSEKSQDA